MRQQFDSSDIAGTLGGAVSVAGKNIILNVMEGSHIDYAVLFDTIILSAIGAICGFIVTEFVKWVKSYILKTWSLKNIIRGFLTTVIGVALICSGGFLMYTAIKSQSWESIATLTAEGVGLMGSGAYLLGVQDPRLPRKFSKKP